MLVSIVALWIVASLGAAEPQDGDSTKMRLARILALGDYATEEDIAALGEHPDEESFQALKKVVEELDYFSQMNAAFRALRRFKGTELEPRVVDYVAGEVFDRSELVREPAAWALVVFGAEAELERVVRESKDPLCRAIALQGLVKRIEAEKKPDGLALLVENAILGTTAYRPRFVELLRGFEGEEALAVLARGLLDKDVSPFVKTTIVESLGARPEVGPGSVVVRDALRVRHPSVEYTALRLLLDPAGLAPAPFRNEVARLQRSDDASVRRLATIVEGRIRSVEPVEDQVKWLRKLSKAAPPAERQASAFLLAELGTPEAGELLHALLDDPDRSVASEALIAVGEMRSEASIPVLIRLLARATGQPRFDVPETLAWLTGESHGLSAARWQAWWDAEGADFQLPLPEEVLARRAAREEQRDEAETRAAFYGLPVVSERLVFVLDTSGSMTHEVSEDVTRHDVALRELQAVLDQLPDGTLVNVVFFSTWVSAWSKAPVPLDPEQRLLLQQFIRAQEPEGQTNLYDALETAMLDRRIDTLYLLTDGLPEGGATTDRYQILHEVARWNSTGHVVIHGVSVGEENELVRELASATKGRYLVAK